ncbi:PucR family transcriptional regulator [Actinokineospora spheciospongiae]|uniref:PucR family transcriptional regulator n=1 Tax=Actinokineospora spheciospongiae TaxID=909613 RepID=UPI000D70F460|nr:helix-turn-helix domain-containing protein [Actinokineospora spheciospongiae]PWW66554.1 PucR-like helix-turn-helix protein [Actinokineospora spheciospongiae]
MSVALSRLLSVGFFSDQTVFASERSLETPVDSVTAAPAAAAVAEVTPASLVVFGRTQLRAEDVDTDLAIRLAAERGATGLLLQRPPQPLPQATRSLAERSGVALVLVEDAEPNRLVPAMDRYVRAPESADSGLVGLVAHRLRAAPPDPAEMVRLLGTALRHPVGLVDPTGRVVAGDLRPALLPLTAPTAARLAAARPLSRVCSAGPDALLLLHPVHPTPGGPANLWLAAEVPVSPAAHVRVVTQALGVAAWAFVAHFATAAVDLERRGRRLEALLTRLLEEAGAPRLPVLEQATAAGWRLGGWHSGVHVRFRAGQTPTAVVRDRLREHLATRGVRAEPVPYADGWSLWTTSPVAPGPQAQVDLIDAVRRALLAAEHDCPDLRLCAGVGSAAEGTAGLRDSLREARRASVLAGARDVAGAVEHIGANDVKRLLSNRYTTGVQQDLAHQLLGPLGADASGQLLHTLSCYLDNKSSATATAAVLGVHRNTVLQRLDRIRTLLTVDFTDPDERLALHLATRLVRTGTPHRAGEDVAAS